MSFLSHLGATAYKFEIELVLVNLRCDATQTQPIWIEWKRGSSSRKSATVTGERGFYDFGKKSLTIESTMYMKKNKFQKKESRLTVKQQVGGGGKSGGKEVVMGYIDVDLSNYVKLDQDVGESLTMNLSKSTDKQARLTFRLNTHWLKNAEINSDDEMSRSTNFSTLGPGGVTDENSLEESPVHDLDALEHDDDDDDHTNGKGHDDDEDDDVVGKMTKMKVSGKKGRSTVDEDDEDEDEEDARRKVKFSKKSFGRTSRENSLDLPTSSTAAPPKKSNLKNTPSPSPQPPSKSSSKTSSRQPQPPPPDESDEEHDDDHHPTNGDGGHDGHEEEEEEHIAFFGVTLSSIMKSQQETFPDLEVPVILDVLLRGLEKTGGLTTEGLFRISPLQKARDELKRSFDQGIFSLPKDALISAALLKYWFSELSEPLFPDKLLPTILEVGRIPPPASAEPVSDESDSDSDEEYRRKRKSAKAKSASAAASPDSPELMDGLKDILTKLPSLNLKVLNRLVQFLNKVAQNQSKNKMSLHALAVIFAPTLIHLPMPDSSSTKRGSSSGGDIQQDTKRTVNFLEHLFSHSTLIDQATKGELKSSTSTAKSTNKSDNATTTKSSSKKPPPPPKPDSEEEDEEDHDQLPSFSHSVELDPLSDEEPPPTGSKASLASAAAKKEADAAMAAMEALIKQEEADKKKKLTKKPSKEMSEESDEEDTQTTSTRRGASAASVTSSSTKSTPATKSTTASGTRRPGRKGGAPPPDDDDDTDEEDEKRRELFKKMGKPVDTPVGAPSTKDLLFAKKNTPSPTPATTNTKSPSPTNKSTSNTTSTTTTSASASSSTTKKPSPPKDDSDSDEDVTAEKPASDDIKNLLFAKKGSSSALTSKTTTKDEPKKVAKDEKKDNKKPPPASVKATFGEDTDEDEHGFPTNDQSPNQDQHSDDDDDEGVPQPLPRKSSNSKKPPPPPVPSPSPRSAVAALSAVAAAKGKEMTNQRETNGASKDSSSAEILALKAQIAQLQKEKEDAAEHIAELEDELDHAGGGSNGATVQLEKEVKRLKAENEQLQQTLTASSSGSGGSTAKQLDALKKQIVVLTQENADGLADYDELEIKYNELRRTLQETKKALKAKENEVEDLKEQVVEAEARIGKSPSSTTSASSSRTNGSVGGLSEAKLHEQLSLLEIRSSETIAELQAKLESEQKLSKSLQVQLASTQKENEILRNRDLKFNDLNVIKSHLDPKLNAKEKTQMDLIDAYQASQQRVRFLNTQLKEVEQTLIISKQGWMMTMQVLQDQITAGEAEIKELKIRIEELEKKRGEVSFDQEQFELTNKKLRKSEQSRSKQAELLASLESELSKKKLELKTALQSIIDLQGDNARIKEDLVRSGLALKTIAEDNFELKEYMRLNHKGKK